MTPERWREVLAVAEPALERPPHERAEFVRRACGADHALRAEVESLLAAEAAADDFLETPAPAAAALEAESFTLTGTLTGRLLDDDDLATRLQAALGDAFLVERELAGGGMSRVFVAEEVALGRRVAVKVLPPGLGAALDAARFRREVRLAASLRHPHVVPLLAAGESRGVVYYTMPYVEGESLKQRLDRDGALPPADVAHIVREVAGALAYAHRRGVVHRDVKPGNVLVDEEHVLVTDFGIAKAVSAATAAPEAAGGDAVRETWGDRPAALTSNGLVLGTPAYISPEQAAGRAEVDGRSDVYSLGCMAFEMLTGAPPFAPSGTGDLVGRWDAPPPMASARRPGLPAVDAVLARAMAPAPADRYHSAPDFADALARAIAGAAVPPAPARRRWTRPAALALVAVLAVVVAVAAGREWAGGGAAGGSVAAARPRLAVLPFVNRGAGEDEYFADGLTEELTRRLGRVSGLAVIARPSAMLYRGSRESVARIGGDLGVGYVVEGTVTRERSAGGAGRLRMEARLVRAADGRRVWSEEYDGAPDGLFAMQAAVAGRVAAALDVPLADADRRALDTPPTRDIAAFDDYLRGNALTTRPNWFKADARREAVRRYERAVARDPSFAAAWARLAVAYRRQHVAGDDAGASVLEPARAAAARAFALDSTLPEANIAMGALTSDRWSAVERYVLALRSHPQSVELLYALAAEQAQLGRQEDALASLARAAALDPRSPSAPAEIAALHDVGRDYARAVRARERELALTPDNPVTYVAQGLSYFNGRGDTAAARAIVARGVAATGRQSMVRVLASRPGVLATRVLWPLLDDDTRAALDTLTVAGAGAPTWQLYRLKAEHLEHRGDSAAARAYHDSARLALEPRVRDGPDDAEAQGALGLAYAGLGRAAPALAAARRGLELARAPRSPYDSLSSAFVLAMVAARVGDRDVALDALAVGLPRIEPSVTPWWLRFDPLWAPLRRDPRFVRLAAGAPGSGAR